MGSSDAYATGGAIHRNHARISLGPVVVSGFDREVDVGAGAGLDRLGPGDAVGLGEMSGAAGVTVEAAAGVVSGTGASSGPGDSNGSVNPNKRCNSGSVS